MDNQATAELHRWLESLAYLPDFMRDFHDQKDLFKAIHDIVHANEGTKRVNWIDAQIYTVDVFLWFLARHGYTMQRTRTKCEFIDLHKTVADAKKAREEAFYAVLRPATQEGEK